MKKFLVLFAVVTLLFVACGGGGGGGGGPSTSVSVTELSDSQRAALRDLGVYNAEDIPLDETVNPVASAKGATVGKAMNLIKAFISDSGSETTDGLDGQGSMTLQYDADGDVNESGGNLSFTFTTTASDFYRLGACNQAVHFSGVVICSFHASISSNYDTHMDGNCATQDVIDYTGADGVPYEISYNYDIDLDGNVSSGVVTNSTIGGWVAISGLGVNVNELGEMPTCINPEVLEVSPAALAEDVSVDTAIQVTFDQEMNPSTIESAFTLTGGYSEIESVPGLFSWSGNIMTFTPSSPLNHQTDYTVSISTDAVDSLGYPISPAYDGSFTTTSYPLEIVDSVVVSDAVKLIGISWDGSNLWVLDQKSPKCNLFKIDRSDGSTVGETVETSFSETWFCDAEYLEWDGSNFWSTENETLGNSLIKIAVDGSGTSYNTTASYFEGFAYDGTNFATTDNYDYLRIVNSSGSELSVTEIDTDYGDYVYADAMVWCGGSYWLSDYITIFRIDSSIGGIDLSVDLDIDSNSIADMTCDRNANTLWIATVLPSGDQGVYEIQLP